MSTTTAPSTGTESPQTFEDLARHIDELRDRVSHLDPVANDLLKQTIEAVTEFNKVGLISLVQLLREDPRGGELLYEAVEMPAVMALFVSHGLIRTDRAIDVLRVVEQIRPYLVTSSIEMEVESVTDDVAFVRFAKGCSAPDQQVKDEIMGVIMQRVPGLKGVEEVKEQSSSTFISLDTLKIGPA